MPYLAQSIKIELQGVCMTANKAGLCPQAPFYTPLTPPPISENNDRAIHIESAVLLLQEMIESLRDFPLCAKSLELPPHKEIILDKNIAMIYALTPRSHIYLKTLLSEGIAPCFVLLLGMGKDIKPLQESLFLLGIQTHHIVSEDINAQEVFDYVMSLSQKYVIYSGYGGGILQKAYFESDKSFIHIHAGKLPQYRGSTTCYYSLLEEGEISASAMFLNHQLDGGDVLAHFGLNIPQIRALENTDIDLSVEPYIRAKALALALKDYKHQGAFNPITQQDTQEESTYYRIHPTLKHLAMFACFSSPLREEL